MIDYTSLERDDLMVFAEGDGQLDYVQREVYAGSERIEQFTDRSGGGYERLLYVHEDLQGNTRYYTKANGQSYAELAYDAWGMPESPNKLLNNDHGNYVYATYTGHIFDTTLDIYFCEARFYDANTRTWLAMDPIKDGDNWYQYCYSNPLRYWDPTGLAPNNYFQTLMCGATSGTLDILYSMLSSLMQEASAMINEIIATITVTVASFGAMISAIPTVLVIGGVVVVILVIGGSVLYWSGTKEETTGEDSKLEKDINDVLENDKNADSDSETVTSNTGREIDVTKKDNHSSTTKNPGPYGETDSSVDIVDENGQIKTRRWYDDEGHAYRDVDMTNHGNPKEHPEWPHEHTWDWSSGVPLRK